MVCVDINRFNQRIKFLLKLFLDFDPIKAREWFFNTIEREDPLLLDSSQIPFDVIYFGLINYLLALHDNVFHLVKEKVIPKDSGPNMVLISKVVYLLTACISKGKCLGFDS